MKLWPTPYKRNPPKQWLTEPHAELSAINRMVVTRDGRFSVVSHEWDRIHADASLGGWKAPRSRIGNRMFHQGITLTADGEPVRTGNLSFGGGHLTASERNQFRSKGDPRKVVAVGQAVELDDYLAVCGFIAPGTTEEQVLEMLATPVSGEWAIHDGHREYIGPQFVDAPGLAVGLDQLTPEQVEAEFQKIADLFETKQDSEGRLVFASRYSQNSYNLKDRQSKEQTEMQQIKTLIESKIDEAFKLAGTDVITASMDGETETSDEVTSDELSDDVAARLDAIERQNEILEGQIIQIQSFLESLTVEAQDLEE